MNWPLPPAVSFDNRMYVWLRFRYSLVDGQIIEESMVSSANQTKLNQTALAF